jgi:hypothetical protein
MLGNKGVIGSNQGGIGKRLAAIPFCWNFVPAGGQWPITAMLNYFTRIPYVCLCGLTGWRFVVSLKNVKRRGGSLGRTILGSPVSLTELFSIMGFVTSLFFLFF